MDLPLSSCLREIIAMTEDIRRRPLGVFDRSNQVVDILPKLLDRIFPDDAHKRVSDRLHICMTRLKDMKKVIVNKFDSKKDLIDALNCSCFIPVWSGNHVSTYKGVKHIDGGFSDNLPVFDEHTIRICCFAGATDISPYDRAKMELLSGTVLNTPLYLNLANCRRFRKALFPPPASFIVDLLERGFQDARDFILSNDLIQCDFCHSTTAQHLQPIYAKLSPTITPSISPAHSISCKLNEISTHSDQHKAKFNSNEKKANLNNQLRVDNNKSGQLFHNLLREKLNSYSSSTLGSCSEHSSSSHDESQADRAELAKMKLEEDNNNNNNNLCVMPTIRLESAPDEPQQQQAASRKFLSRRNTEQHLQVGATMDKFAQVANPLPSFPPSPNLNRHCSECIRMRQEARLALVSEDVQREVHKYHSVEEQKKADSFKQRRFYLPRWLRQLGSRSSYKFTQVQCAQ